MPQNDARRPQHSRHKNKHAKPPHRIIVEQRTECHQSPDDSPRSRHVLAQLPPDIEQHAHHLNDERRQNDIRHIPRQIEPLHHQQAEYIGDNSKQIGHIPTFPSRQFGMCKTVDFAKQEDGQHRHQNSEAIDHPQHYQLIRPRHHAKVREDEQHQICQERHRKRRKHPRDDAGRTYQRLM